MKWGKFNHTNMITENEACRIVQEQLPEISGALPPEGDIYGTINVVQEFACQKAREHNYSRLQQCFSLAESLHEKGSSSVRCAVENVFVYSLSRLFTIVPEEKNHIKALIPQSLQSLYVNQVLHHGY